MVWFEDLPLDFTRAETREAERLLATGYSTNIAALTLAQDAGLDSAQLDQMAPVKFLARDILKKARQSNRLLQLIVEVLSDSGQEAIHDRFSRLIAGHEATIAAAALQRKPSIATLAMLPSSMEVWGANDATARPLASGGLEKLINAAAGFADIAIFRQGLAEAEVRTARIEIGGKPKGTGFLVGESLLLTNWHVVKNGINGAVATFDKKVLPGGTDASKGRSVPVTSVVVHSPHEVPSIEISPDGPQKGTWDFALVRLEKPVGSQPIGPEPLVEGAEPRGSYQLDGAQYDFDPAEPLLIVGHPNARPTQLSYASPSGVAYTRHQSRLRYQTNTEGGSSGSPVFNREWRVVGLHHAGGPTSISGEFNLQSAQFNQGIAIANIVSCLKEQLAGKPELAELGLE